MIFCLRLLFVFLVLLNSNSWAQSNFRKGYIVKKSNDTIRGFIDDRSDYKNTRHLKFKSRENDIPQIFTPDDLLSYHVSGKYYFPKNITLKEYDVVVKKKGFVQALVQGKASLYYYKGKDLGNHYYIQKDSTLSELIYEEIYYVKEDGKTYAKENRHYLKIFAEFFKDCSDLSLRKYIDFEESELEKVVSKYNNCGNVTVADSINKIKDKSVTKVTFTGLAGMNFSTITSDNKSFQKLHDRTKIGLTAGVALNFNFNRVNKNLSFQLDLNYNQKGVWATKKKYEINSHYFDLGGLLKYTYPKGEVRPVLGAGPVFGINPRKNTMKGLGDTYFLWYEAGYCLEGGFLFPMPNSKDISLVVRFERCFMGTESYYNYYNKVIQFKLGYRFL